MDEVNCEQFREWIELSAQVELESVPAEFEEHLKSCADCRAIYEETHRVFTRMNVADDHMAESINADIFVSEINSRIDKVQLANPRKKRWPRYAMAAAAAVALLLGRAYLSNPDDNSLSGFSIIGDDDREKIFELDGNPAVETDQDLVNLMLLDVDPLNQFEIEDRFLYELSDEELQFLEKNFDVGDLL